MIKVITKITSEKINEAVTLSKTREDYLILDGYHGRYGMRFVPSKDLFEIIEIEGV